MRQHLNLISTFRLKAYTSASSRLSNESVCREVRPARVQAANSKRKIATLMPRTIFSVRPRRDLSASRVQLLFSQFPSWHSPYSLNAPHCKLYSCHRVKRRRNENRQTGKGNRLRRADRPSLRKEGPHVAAGSQSQRLLPLLCGRRCRLRFIRRCRELGMSLPEVRVLLRYARRVRCLDPSVNTQQCGACKAGPLRPSRSA